MHALRPAFLFLLIALVAACQSRTAADFEKSGDQYMADKHFGEAAIQYLNALNKEPERGDIRFKLAEAWLYEGNIRAAFPQFVRAADQLPDNLDAQRRAAYFLLKGGLFKEAKERARLVLQKSPADVDALMILGNSLAGLQTLDEAVGVFKRAIEIDPERVGLYTSLGVMQLAQHDHDEAEAAFKQALEVSKGSPEAYMALGNFYRSTGNVEEAEKAFKTALAANPKSLVANQSLAGLYVDNQREAEAEPFIKTVIAVSKDPAASLSLADYYLATNRPDDATQVLNGLASNTPSLFSEAKLRLAMIEFSAGRRAAAHQHVDAVLARTARDSDALTMKARLLLADGKPDDAREKVEAALDANPKSALAHLSKARILVSTNHQTDAIKEFKETIALDPGSLAAQLELADFHRRRTEIDTALGYADQAIKAHPNNLQARLTRVRVYLSRDTDYDRAAKELDTLTKRYPGASAVFVALGQFCLTINNMPRARDAFNHALELAPQSVEAMTGVITVDLARRDLGGARAHIDSALARSPNNVGFLLIAAKIYGMQGESSRSEATLIKIIGMDPSIPTTYGLLAGLYQTQGRIEDAKKQFVALANAEPRSLAAPTMLGVLYYSTNDKAAAEKWWSRALEIDATTASAANNLAWLWAESDENLDRALALAQMARAAMPEQPEVNDTLGWILHKKDLNDQAVQYLRRSVEIDRSEPAYQFHLGMVYAEMGEDAKARTALEAALALNKTFDGAAQARQTLTRLVY